MSDFVILLAQRDISEDDIQLIINMSESDRKLAAQKSSCLSLLADLAFDRSANVRLALLKNPALNRTLVEVLQKDIDPTVAEAAKNRRDNGCE